jgi:hypothetical protein
MHAVLNVKVIVVRHAVINNRIFADIVVYIFACVTGKCGSKIYFQVAQPVVMQKMIYNPSRKSKRLRRVKHIERARTKSKNT